MARLAAYSVLSHYLNQCWVIDWQLVLWEPIPVKFESKYIQIFPHSRKWYIWKCLLQKLWPFCLVLMAWLWSTSLVLRLFLSVHSSGETEKWAIYSAYPIIHASGEKPILWDWNSHWMRQGTVFAGAGSLNPSDLRHNFNAGIARLCAFSLLAHSNSKRHIKLSIFFFFT